MIRYKATITGKRQVTIPMEVSKLLNIKEGDMSKLLFNVNDEGTINITIEKSHQKCFACNGEGIIDNNTCFICEGNKNIPCDIDERAYEFIGYIKMLSRRSGVIINIVNETVKDYLNNDVNIPKIVISTNADYSKESLSNITSELERLIYKFEYNHNTFLSENERNVMYLKSRDN